MAAPRLLPVVLLAALIFSCASNSPVPNGNSDSPDIPGNQDSLQGSAPVLVSPSDPIPDPSPLLEELKAPWDAELAALVTEKPRISPSALIPPRLPSLAEPVLEKPSFRPQATPVVTVPESDKSPSGSLPPRENPPEPPVSPTPRPSNPAMRPRPAPAPAPLLKVPPEPDLRPVSAPVMAPEVEYEDVTSKPGDDVYFQFSPQGWTFNDRDEVGRAAGYQSMDLRDAARTVFLFRPTKTGTFELEFRRLDMATGTSRTKVVRLKVLGAGETLLNRQVVPRDLAEILIQGHRLEQAGKDGEARDLYLNHYDPTSQELNWRLGNLYKKAGDRPQAEDYWKLNLDNPGTWTEASWLELISSALRAESTQEILTWADWGLEKKFILPEDTLLRVVDHLGSRDLLKEAFFWLEEYGKQYERSRKSDQALFMHAQFLEREGPYRNIREALRLYRQLRKDHPLSPWWTRAGERAAELERQFLRIR